MHRAFRRGALVVACVLVAGCSDGAGRPAGSPASSSASGVCAWSVRADKATLNVAYPDTSATYWALSYALADGEHLELTGRYPAARYASYVTYGPAGGAIDSLTDEDIVPDPPGPNPFRASAAPPSSTGARAQYHVTIERGASTDQDHNRLATETPQGAAPPSSAGPPTVGRVLLGSGGDGAVVGTVLYRVYLPSDGSDPTGGAGLPDVRLVGASGASTVVPTCPNPGPSQVALDIVNSFDRPVQPPPATPTFIRPQQASINLYPNPDSVYVATTIVHQPGRVVIIRGRAPTFPDTRHGAPITGNEQVRFWSMCTNELRKPYPVTECAADDETKLDAGGSYTYVISTRDERPADTPATAGSTWLDWGSTDVPTLLLLRHMLPNPSFAQSANRVEPGALAADVMKEYAPHGAYCDKAVFEQGGAAACGL